MRSPVSRVAATAIFVLTIAGVALWFHGGGTTPAFANFLQPLLDAKTVKYKVTIEVTSPLAGTTALSAETQKDLLTQTAVVMMPDAKRSRTEWKMAGKPQRVEIWDGSQGKSLMLEPAEKRATVYHAADMPKPETPQGKDRRSASPRGGPGEPWPVATFRSLVRGALDKPGVKTESLGQQEIDGRRVVGFRISGSGAVVSLWGDPKTGTPVRIESTDATIPYLKVTMSDFVLNVPMDDSLFSVEPPEGYQVTVGQYQTTDDSPAKERELIEMFRYYSEVSGGRFPEVLDLEWIADTVRHEEWWVRNLRLSHKPTAKREQGEHTIERGMQFTALLPKEADVHYAGKGFSLGALHKPIFWYRPEDATKYRVIDADLSVRETGTPPSVPVVTVAQMEQDLIEMFRQYSQLSGGPFPDLLDSDSFFTMFTMKREREKPDKPSVKQEQALAEAWAKLQQGLIFTALLPKEADAHYAGNGVLLGAAGRPIFWYRPKDAKAYRVVYADLSVRDAETPPNLPVAQPETPLLNTLRCYSELFGGPFPNSLEQQSFLSVLSMKLSMKFISQGAQQPTAKQEQEMTKAMMQFEPGLIFAFAASRPPDADAHYAGRGVSLGAAERPIFWYRPLGGKTYRVIYGDLSVRDADTPPSVPNAQPEADLIDELRDYSQLSGGPFPDSLDQEMLSPLLEKKLGLQKQHEPNPKQIQELMEIQLKLVPGAMFIDALSREADAHYAGKGVSLGALHKPIFWYRPKDSKKYRVIYGDLSLRDADAPPNVPHAQPLPTTSILRYGPFQ